MLLERLARVTVLRSVLSEVFDKAGYRLEFDTAEGQTWRYAAKPAPPPAPPPPRPAPVQTPQPASRDRSTAAQGRRGDVDLIIGSYVNKRTEPRRARAPRRAVERVISPPPWSPANFDVLRPLPRDTPLPSPVWFRPSGRPISGGIQG